MFFQIVHPFYNIIEGDSFKQAIKNYVKFNDDLRISNLIIKDMQNNRHNVNIRRYFENNKSKVGIDVYPYTNIDPTQNVFLPPNSVVQPVNIVSPFLGPIVTGPNSRIIATDSNVFYRVGN